jgi:GNAT superfamily N-acetyltransferase/RimJ/RimL family protein N-acetyltransferase
MRIERVDPADTDAVRACHAVHVAARAADDPEGDPPFSLALFSALLEYGWSCDPTEAWCVPGDSPGVAGRGEPVAAFCRILLPDLENRGRAFVSVTVHPASRRRGLGRALLRHAARRAQAGGRSDIDGSVAQGSAGEAFARQLGAVPGLVDARRFLDLRKVPASRFAELRAEAARHAYGYSLISWTGVTPEEELGRVAGVFNAMNDAPREEGLFEDDIWDADRVRDRGDMQVRFAGNRGYSVAAVHDVTGEMAALTQLFVDPADPDWGHQGLTGVTRPHRGHRLGLLTKAAMLDWMATAEPQLEHIETNNAAANSYMIAVNEALGFELAEPSFQFFALQVTQAG